MHVLNTWLYKAHTTEWDGRTIDAREYYTAANSASEKLGCATAHRRQNLVPGPAGIRRSGEAVIRLKRESQDGRWCFFLLALTSATTKRTLGGGHFISWLSRPVVGIYLSLDQLQALYGKQPNFQATTGVPAEVELSPAPSCRTHDEGFIYTDPSFNQLLCKSTCCQRPFASGRKTRGLCAACTLSLRRDDEADCRRTRRHAGAVDGEGDISPAERHCALIGPRWA